MKTGNKDLVFGEYPIAGQLDMTRTASENAYNLEIHYTACFGDRLHAQDTSDRAPIWWYNADAGIWQDTAIDIMRKQITEGMAPRFVPAIVANTITAVRNRSYNPDIKLGEMCPDKVVVENGTLNLTTMELEEHSLDNYAILQLPVTYDPEAKCPEFWEWFAQVIKEPNDKRAIMEFWGYGLVGDYRFDDIMLYVGSGSNGKSTTMDVQIAFFGQENVSSMTLQTLSANRFAAATLRSKFANICSDLPSYPLKHTGAIKTLTGDLVNTEIKNGPQITFRNRAKLSFACNVLPASHDPSDAFYRRCRIIDFEQTFEEGAAGTFNKAELLERLTTPEEKSGQLNLALRAWQQYNKQRSLSGSPTTKEKKLDYMKRSNLFLYFVEMFLEPASESTEYEHRELYSYFTKMCGELGRSHEAIGTTQFSIKIGQFVPYADEGKHPDTRRRIWKGVYFKEGDYFKEFPNIREFVSETAQFEIDEQKRLSEAQYK